MRAGAASAAPGFRVEGTQMVVETADGQVLRGAEIEGHELDLGAVGVWRILRVARDAEARFPDETLVVDAQMRAMDGVEFSNACANGPNQDGRAVFYSGYLDRDLRYVADPTRFSISCMSGVEAKCLRWGYLPWRRSPIGDQSLAPYFETCLRLARADYCGEGEATTREGTAIDAYDTVGIMQRTPNLPDFAFEAGWTPEGAVCAHHARIPEHLEVASLAVDCPRMANAPIGEACDEDRAKALGALIVTRSVIRDASPTGEAKSAH
jgi:hypothetical protein